MDIGWLHYAFVFVGREKGGYEHYFVACACSSRWILQRNWRRSFVSAWTRDDSIIYVGFSFRSMRSYYGLVEARAPHERWVEHWRAIRQHQTGLASNREEKYAYMAANGGISQWFFLPYVSCGKQIELNRLQQLEQSIIRRFPNALNKCRHPAALTECCNRL